MAGFHVLLIVYVGVNPTHVGVVYVALLMERVRIPPSTPIRILWGGFCMKIFWGIVLGILLAVCAFAITVAICALVHKIGFFDQIIDWAEYFNGLVKPATTVGA